MKKSLIINPSQQAGIEAPLVAKISISLHHQLKKDNLINSYLIDLKNPIGYTDKQLLQKSVESCNGLYAMLRKVIQAPHYGIAQIDLHADSYDKKSFGCSVYYLLQSRPGEKMGKLVYSEVAAITPWLDRGVHPDETYYTLRYSKPCNILLEVSFYDEPLQLKWIQDNAFLIASAIRRGYYSYFGIDRSQSFIESVLYLQSLGIIHSPEYWIEEHYYQQEFLTQLLYNAQPNNTCRWDSLIQYYANEGVIDTPEYWLKQAYINDYSNTFIEGFIIKIARWMKGKLN